MKIRNSSVKTICLPNNMGRGVAEQPHYLYVLSSTSTHLSFLDAQLLANSEKSRIAKSKKSCSEVSTVPQERFFKLMIFNSHIQLHSL